MIPLEVAVDIGTDDEIEIEVETGASSGGLPPVTELQNGKILQVNNGTWKIQHPILGEESIHLLTNMEIENLLK